MDASLALVRFAGFGAGVALFGIPLFALYGGLSTEAAPRRLSWLQSIAAMVAVAAAGAALVLQTGQMAGDPAAGLDPATLGDVVVTSAFGRSVVVRSGAALLALAVLAALRPIRLRLALAAALGAVGLGALAWAGHGAADEGLAGLAHTTADVIHLLAVGVWLGALIVLALLLFDHPTDIDLLHRALTRFSGIGSAVVSAILASGLVNSWFLIGSADVATLPASPWGRLLLLKIALFAVMLGFAALNRFRLAPRLNTPTRETVGALRWSIALESAAGLTVLALVAVLGLFTPPAAA